MRPVNTLAAPLVLIVMVLAAYSPLWGNGFVDFDDEPYVTANPDVLGGLSPEGMYWAFNNSDPYWMPLTWLSLQLDAQLFGSNLSVLAVAVHGQNLFWHLASVLLLFGLLFRLTGARWRSFLVAALFALHPMHVESVAWAAERKDVLSCFFGILTLWAYVRYRERPHRSRYLAMLVTYALSLLAKPMLITLPCVLLLLDYWPLRRKASASWLLLEKIPLFLVAACSAAVTLEARTAHGSLIPLDVLPFSARLANVLSAYGWYLGSTLCPSRLAILYPHPGEHWSLAALAKGGALLVSLTFLAWQQRKRQPWLLVGWLWFVGTLVPVLGFAQGGRQAWADRFSYWPHVGLFVALVWGLAELATRIRLPSKVIGMTAVFVLGILGSLTGSQVGRWRNSETIWEHAVAVTSDNASTHEHLSLCYRRLSRHHEADHHLLQACRIQRKRFRILPQRQASETVGLEAMNVSRDGAPVRNTDPMPGPRAPREVGARDLPHRTTQAVLPSL